MYNQNERELFIKMKAGEKLAFEKLFYKYYPSLCLFARRFVDDKDKAEEIVQDLFVRFWLKREKIQIEFSVKQYLIQSVKHTCLNYIQHDKVKREYLRRISENTKGSEELNPYFMEVYLKNKIEESILSLPEKRREIFRLSREEGLSYKEIATKLNISVKTVETQMGLALKQLREMLRDYKDYLIGLTITIKKS